MNKFHVAVVFLNCFIVFGDCTVSMHRTRQKELPSKQVVFTNIGQCADKEQLPIVVPPMDIIREGKNEYFISGNCSIKQDFDEGLNLKISISKCDDAINSDLCTAVIKESDTIAINFCESVHIQLPAFKNVLNFTKPPLLCPLKQGLYQMTRVFVDNTFLKLEQGPKSHYWDIMLRGFNLTSDIEVMCVKISFYTRQKRLLI